MVPAGMIIIGVRDTRFCRVPACGRAGFVEEPVAGVDGVVG